MSWKEKYLDLCYCCASDPATTGNMLSVVVPALQEEAAKIRAALTDFPSVWMVWQKLEQEAVELESAIANARQRCHRKPVQRQLFAA